MSTRTDLWEIVVRSTECGGIIVTAFGIGLTFYLEPSGRPGGYVASAGLVLTFIGFLAQCQLSKHQKAEKVADGTRIRELGYRLLDVEKIANDPAIAEARDQWLP